MTVSTLDVQFPLSLQWKGKKGFPKEGFKSYTLRWWFIWLCFWRSTSLSLWNRHRKPWYQRWCLSTYFLP